MTEDAKNTNNWGGFIGVLLGACAGGFVGTHGLALGFVVVEFGKNIIAGNIPALPLSFDNQDVSSVGIYVVVVPFASLVCLVCGCLFLGANQQSGFTKYRSAALTGAFCLTVPMILPLLCSALAESKITETLALAIPTILAGSAAAIAFLGVVQLFDRQREFFKAKEEKDTL